MATYDLDLEGADGRPLAGIKGVERRDAAILAAARCVLGLDHTLPRAARATVTERDNRKPASAARSWTLAGVAQG